MSYQVTIDPIGEVIEVEEDQTILDAALRAGIYLPHACGHGLCGTCKVEIQEGDFEHGDASPFALLEMEKEEGKCLACCATPNSDLTIEADSEEDPDAESYPVRDFVATVSKIESLTPRIIAIFMVLEETDFKFQAGQYVNINIPGLDDYPRAFSIASPPSDNKVIELNVCLVEGGKGTQWLHNNLKVGESLSFSGPYGRFFFRQSQKAPAIFLAGGSGLSSPKSMVLDLIEKNETRPITLIYGAREQSELYYRSLFEELDNEHENFRYVAALSDEPEDSDWTGYRGYVHEVAKQVFDNKFEGYNAYMCGPPPMVDACITTLMQGRLFEKEMFMENFYSNANKDDKPKSPLFKSI